MDKKAFFNRVFLVAATIAIILLLVLLILNMSKKHKAYRVLDIENSNIYFGMSVDQLREERGEPEQIDKNVCDTPADEYIYHEEYLGHKAKIAYRANPKLAGYLAVVHNIDKKQGEQLFDETEARIKERIGNIKIDEEMVSKKGDKMEGKIHISCQIYGLTFINANGGKYFHWSYKNGKFTFSISEVY